MSSIIDLGKLRFRFAGEFDANTVYEKNDVVKYGGNIYCYIHPLKAAGVIPTVTTSWALMLKGINFEGVWGNTTTYEVGDGVAHGGNVYVAIKDSTGVTPGTDATTWSTFVDGIQWEGVYDNVKSYQKNDVVKYGGSAYIAKQDTVGNLPTNATFWTEFVSGISPQSVYNPATNYVPNDLVAYGGNLYRAKVNVVGVAPASDATKWELYVGGSAFKGAWAAATAYKTGEVVTYGGGVYRAKVDTTAGQLPTDNTKFDPYLVGMTYVGTYNTGTAYKTGEVVTYGANLYRAKVDVAAGVLPTDNTKYDLISTGIRVVGAWAAATTYLLNDVVTHGGNAYIALVGHVSAGFDADLAAAKWQKFNSGVRYRGAWVTGTTYLKDDLVTNGLSTYIATADHVAGATHAADISGGKWQTFALGQANVPDPAGNNGRVLGVQGGVYTLMDAKPTVVQVAGNITLTDGLSYVIDHSVVQPVPSITMTLPLNPSATARVTILDGTQQCEMYPVTIARNGKKIDGLAEDLILDVNGVNITLTYINETIGWRIS